MPNRVVLALILLASGALLLAQERSKGSEKKSQLELQKSNDELKKGSPSADVEKKGGKPRMSVSTPDQHRDYSMKQMKPKPTAEEEPADKDDAKNRSSDQRQPKEDKSGGKSQPAKKN